MILAKQRNTQVHLKAGLMGFAGDGKPYHPCEIVPDPIHLMRERELDAGNRRVMFLYTEADHDWVAPRFARIGVELTHARATEHDVVFPEHVLA